VSILITRAKYGAEALRLLEVNSGFTAKDMIKVFIFLASILYKVGNVHQTPQDGQVSSS